MTEEKKTNESTDGYIFDLIDFIKEMLTEYNYTIRGKCSICLEEYVEDSESTHEEVKFTDRDDLVKLSECFHRFHLICL